MGNWTYYNITSNGTFSSTLTALDTATGNYLVPGIILSVFAIVLIATFYRNPKISIAISGAFSLITTMLLRIIVTVDEMYVLTSFGLLLVGLIVWIFSPKSYGE